MLAPLVVLLVGLLLVQLKCMSNTVNVLKCQTLFSFCFQIKCWVSGLEFTECLSE